MNVGARARFALMIGLGLLTGLSFITLPAVLTGYQSSSPQTLKTGTNSTTPPAPGFTGSVTGLSPANTTRTPTTPPETGLNVTGLSILISILVIPALAISFLAFTWAVRRRTTGSKEVSEGAD